MKTFQSWIQKIWWIKLAVMKVAGKTWKVWVPAVRGRLLLKNLPGLDSITLAG